MNTRQSIIDFDMKAKLSILWIFILLNVIFQDAHQLFRVGFLEEIMGGVINNTQIMKGILSPSGMMVEIALVMIVLSQILPYQSNLWVNITSVVVTFILILQNDLKDFDDKFFATIEIIALISIIWYACRLTLSLVEIEKFKN